MISALDSKVHMFSSASDDDDPSFDLIKIGRGRGNLVVCDKCNYIFQDIERSIANKSSFYSLKCLHSYIKYVSTNILL